MYLFCEVGFILEIRLIILDAVKIMNTLKTYFLIHELSIHKNQVIQKRWIRTYAGIYFLQFQGYPYRGTW